VKAALAIVTNHTLRQQPIWRLLAADKAPAFIGLLQTHLLEADKCLAASVLHERIGRDIELLRARGEDLPQTAQAYVAEWLSQGWLMRRFPAGAPEEEYELTADGAAAIRFVSALDKPRTVATESRLATVIQQLARLAEETDTNPRTRVAALLAERERIEREIADVEQGRLKALPDDRALERVREIIALAEELAGDFRRVRDEFDRLNRGLRENLMETEGSRADTLEALFAGVDLIGASDAGRTFAAFWRLLTQPEQNAALESALSQVSERAFARRLDARERRFLLRLLPALLAEGGSVHEILQQFARSLKTFVQSREYLEQRRLHTLLREAQRAALQARDTVRPTQPLPYELKLTSSRIRSLSQWTLYDPAQRLDDAGMTDGAPALIDLDTVGELVRQSEIDFRTLKQNICSYLDEVSQVSIGQLMLRFPAVQGLGSVVGYVALGARHGERTSELETVAWEGRDGNSRKARIPVIYFLRERMDEFVA
jgi:hypothetical protein